VRVHDAEGQREQVVRRTAALASIVVTAVIAGAPAAVIAPRSAHADAPALAAVALPAPAADDVRRAVLLGPAGEVYEPDGRGGWMHRMHCATAGRIAMAIRAGDAVLALADRAIYRLAGNGWSAIRLVQHGKAILGRGARGVAAVGRQLFALEPLAAGAPPRLAQLPSEITAIGAGAASIVVATDTGLFRITGSRVAAIAPSLTAGQPVRLVDDRWAILGGAAVDLVTGKRIAWPHGVAIDVASGAATSAPGGALVAVGRGAAGLELLSVRSGAIARDPLGITGSAVGVVVDRAGRALVALSDGRIAVRDRTGWTTTTVADEPAAERPGAPPATSI
jgi:hypothetical protein